MDMSEMEIERDNGGKLLMVQIIACWNLNFQNSLQELPACFCPHISNRNMTVTWKTKLNCKWHWTWSFYCYWIRCKIINNLHKIDGSLKSSSDTFNQPLAILTWLNKNSCFSKLNFRNWLLAYLIVTSAHPVTSSLVFAFK